MTQEELWRIAMEQSARDLCCESADFLTEGHTVVFSRENEGARKYLKLPFSCQLVSYGNGVVASVSQKFYDIVKNYIQKYP